MKNIRNSKRVLKDFFNLTDDRATYVELENRIVSGSLIRGTNMAILMLAIFIASIGLNMNSTAVIIGAMLISPLMGSIIAMGYGIATANAKFLRNCALGFAFQVIVSLITSLLYFSISPVSVATSELLARTTPNIWDVLIATCGGLAGAIGISTKETTGNLLPGVAIATALMPPLCTAGYGLSTHSLAYFAGAMYLFLINTYFICFTSVLVFIIIDVPVYDEKERSLLHRKKLHKKLAIGTFIFILPSIIMGAKVVNDSSAEGSALPIESTSNYDTKVLTKELKTLYPEVRYYELGELEHFETHKDVSHTKTIATVCETGHLTAHDKENIEKLIKVHTKVDEVKFVVEY